MWAIGAGCLEAIYIFLLVTIGTVLGNTIEHMSDIVGPVVFISTFVFSAAVSGLLIFGYPVYLLIQRQWKAAIRFSITSIATFFVIIAATALITALLTG